MKVISFIPPYRFRDSLIVQARAVFSPVKRSRYSGNPTLFPAKSPVYSFVHNLPCLVPTSSLKMIISRSSWYPRCTPLAISFSKCVRPSLLGINLFIPSQLTPFYPDKQFPKRWSGSEPLCPRYLLRRRLLSSKRYESFDKVIIPQNYPTF